MSQLHSSQLNEFFTDCGMKSLTTIELRVFWWIQNGMAGHYKILVDVGPKDEKAQ